MSPRQIRESRRLTGPNVLSRHPGAVLDVSLDEGEAAEAVAAWSDAARELLEALGWSNETLTHRVFPGGASLAISAPLDALYAATEINEAAWEEAARRLDGSTSSGEMSSAVIERLRRTIVAEANPSLLALQHAAAHRGLSFLADDDFVSVGLGTGSRTWGVDEIPPAEAVPWASLHDIPLALVTGTNGKSTTIRLLAAMVDAAGQIPGVSSTDWIKVGDDTIDRGDWAGPGGARTILRDPRVDIALLETARGGILRRGLGVTSATVAAILNVAEDHLGEWGVEDLAALVETKFVVARAARRLVLNADDRYIVERARRVDASITWFGLAIDPDLRHHGLDSGGSVITIEDDQILLISKPPAGRPTARRVCGIAEIPITVGGAARYNLSNAMAAIGVALELGLSEPAIVRGVRRFHSNPAENPGRLNRFELGGARVLVDFAHNPHGLQAVMDMAAALPAERRLVLIGQAGDRTDSSIRDLARVVWSARPERVIIKELPENLRGRELGEIPRIMTDELVAAGADLDAIGRADSEIEGVRQALEWARAGDLLLMLTHESRDQVLELCESLARSSWRPGSPLPPTHRD